MTDLSPHAEQTPLSQTRTSTVTTTDPVETTVRVTVPARRRVRLRELWTSFPVARIIASRDIKAKYKQSALGPLWLVLQPIGLLVALVVAFSAVTNVNTGDVPYVIFALVGLAVWNYVQMTFTAGTSALPANAVVVRRSACPRIALVTGTLISMLPPLTVVLTVTVLAAAAAGKLPIQALLLPVMVAWLLAFMWGVTLVVAALGARFRDIVAFAPLIVQAGIFLTPVGYPLNANEAVSKVIALNPISGLIEAWRWSIVDMPPDLFAIGVAAVWTLGLGLLGWYVFGRMETRFADYV
jgi:lipopolysaccharide transport system permease protein